MHLCEQSVDTIEIFEHSELRISLTRVVKNRDMYLGRYMYALTVHHKPSESSIVGRLRQSIPYRILSETSQVSLDSFVLWGRCVIDRSSRRDIKKMYIQSQRRVDLYLTRMRLCIGMAGLILGHALESYLPQVPTCAPLTPVLTTNAGARAGPR